MVFVHSITPLIPSLAAMLTSATKPCVSGETHTRTQKRCHLYRMCRGEGLTGHGSASRKQREIVKDLTSVLTHVSRGFTA